MVYSIAGEYIYIGEESEIILRFENESKASDFLLKLIINKTKEEV